MAGVRSAWVGEASFRTQVVFAAGALAFLLALRPAPVWWALLTLTCAGVLAAELINTALESILDRVHPDLHPEIGRAKDCAAAAVLVFSFASLVVAICLVVSVLAGS